MNKELEELRNLQNKFKEEARNVFANFMLTWEKKTKNFSFGKSELDVAYIFTKETNTYNWTYYLQSGTTAIKIIRRNNEDGDRTIFLDGAYKLSLDIIIKLSVHIPTTLREMLRNITNLICKDRQKRKESIQILEELLEGY